MRPCWLAALVAVCLAAGCSGFGLSEKPNPWLMACEQTTAYLADDATDAEREAAGDELANIVSTYGDSEGETLKFLVGNAAKGAQSGDEKPVRDFHEANCVE